MRGAPPVQLACGPDAPWRWFEQALAALALGTVTGWVALEFDAPVIALWLAAAAAGAFGWALAAASPARHPAAEAFPVLAWDGQRWTFRGHPGEVSVMLDFDGWVLLRVRTSTDRRWVPITLVGRSPAGFRAALQAHAGQASVPAREGRVRDADG